uniref:ATP synthase complex subunit 8 n=1 Tax=Hypothenemus sp. BMNH 1039866 TaxID=1903766 RepID=A0A343A5N8_9CUCU|nr:ATP synthase F0 subunit 8 [Hypothenemus sp. BMNH 1039866]
MPQMAPLSWLSLYMLFSAILIMTMAISFFQVMYTSKKQKTTHHKTPVNWKW